jgi:hypothetical protein
MLDGCLRPRRSGRGHGRRWLDPRVLERGIVRGGHLLRIGQRRRPRRQRRVHAQLRTGRGPALRHDRRLPQGRHVRAGVERRLDVHGHRGRMRHHALHGRRHRGVLRDDHGRHDVVLLRRRGHLSHDEPPALRRHSQLQRWAGLLRVAQLSDRCGVRAELPGAQQPSAVCIHGRLPGRVHVRPDPRGRQPVLRAREHPVRLRGGVHRRGRGVLRHVRAAGAAEPGVRRRRNVHRRRLVCVRRRIELPRRSGLLLDVERRMRPRLPVPRCPGLRLDGRMPVGVRVHPRPEQPLRGVLDALVRRLGRRGLAPHPSLSSTATTCSGLRSHSFCSFAASKNATVVCGRAIAATFGAIRWMASRTP